MSIIIKIGKGLKNRNSFRSSFGGLTGDLNKGMENMTIKKIALQLAKQAKISDGEIEIFNVGFNFRQPLKEETR